MFLNELLVEKKEKKKEIVYSPEWDEQEPFPNDTITKLTRDIVKNAKDLAKNYKNAAELVDTVFKEFKIPMPGAYLRKRWDQYMDLLGIAVRALGDARGFKGQWRTS